MAWRCTSQMMKAQSLLSQEKDSLKYQKEADLTKVVKAWLKSQSYIKADKLSDRFKKGVPDIMACVNGIYVAIELKAEDKKPSAHQRLFIKQVIEVGGIGGTCETLGEVKILIKEALKKFNKTDIQLQ